MIESIIKRFMVGWIGIIAFGSFAAAEAIDSNRSPWIAWLNQQVEQHPEVRAAREKMNATFSLSKGKNRPLYNPELETEYEQQGEFDNYQLGISQTIDLWDKRGIRSRQGASTRTAAKQSYLIIKQKKTAEVLQAIVGWEAAKQRADLAMAQEQQLTSLVSIVKERQQAGDLGAVDAELAFLSLSQKLFETAQAIVSFKEANARLREAIPGWTSERAHIPSELWSLPTLQSNQIPTENTLLDEHPAVMASRFEWNVLQQQAELARRETKADPTVGFNAGRDGDEDYLGLTFSIPLNVRNNFSAEARAASQEALSAEANYLAIRRKQQFMIVAATDALEEYRQRYNYWQTVMEGRGERSGNLLERQWNSGDISTTEYLLALQQRTDGLLAGIDLNTQFQLARIEWLLETGLITKTLAQLAE